MANVQIPQELFLQLCKYHLIGLDDQEIQEAICRGLNEKLDQMARRQTYTAYKTADTPEEREKARLEYLDKIGLSKDFRW